MKIWLIPLAGLLASTVACADNCEPLRASIEGRIREAGVTDVSVVIADANAPANGRNVGSCDMGRKKIVYLQRDANAGAAKLAPILTECRDGSTAVDGRCKN